MTLQAFDIMESRRKMAHFTGREIEGYGRDATQNGQRTLWSSLPPTGIFATLAAALRRVRAFRPIAPRPARAGRDGTRGRRD